MLCKQPRTRILKCAVCAASPVHPGFAASWGLGCQDISLEDNENICCFSSKTDSSNRHGGEHSARLQSSRRCLSHGSEGFGSSSSLRWVPSAQSLPWQPRAASASPPGQISAGNQLWEQGQHLLSLRMPSSPQQDALLCTGAPDLALKSL